MDSFELNKIMGAVLFTLLCLVSLNITAGALFAPHAPAKPGYEIAVPEQAGQGTAAAPVAEEPIEVLLASADVGKGENSAKKCAACHTFDKGGPNRVGPNLWGIVGRAKASPDAGFNFSAALKGKGGNWSIDDLNKFLLNPKGFVPGTAMAFAGLPRGSERADMIAFLNAKADSPAPLPKAAAAPVAPAPQAAAPK